MKKIETLTPEQEAQLAVYRDRYIELGYSTEPVNRDRAEIAINQAYECAGLDKPKQIIWFDSPLSEALGFHFLIKKGDGVVDSVGTGVGVSVLHSVLHSVWDSVLHIIRDTVGVSVQDRVEVSVLHGVLHSIWSSVGASIRDDVLGNVQDRVEVSVVTGVVTGVWNSVEASIRVSIRDSIRDSVGTGSKDWYRASLEGNHLSHWAGWYQYYTEQLGLEIPKGQGLSNLIKECGWVYCGRDIVLVCDRPEICKRKQMPSGRFVLHSEDGPAVRYRDGFEIWAYDGVRLANKKYQCPVTEWQPKWIDEEENADVRTALLKAIGYDRWISETGGKVVHEQIIFNLPYQLITREDPAIGTMKFLKMQNPSVPGVFHIEPVAPYSWIKTCEDALRWRQLGDEAQDTNVKIKYQFIK